MVKDVKETASQELQNHEGLYLLDKCVYNSWMV